MCIRDRVDTVAMTFPQKIEAQQELLSEMDVKVRYKKLIDALDAQREILLLEKDIAKETRKRMEKMQREAYLREQIRSMQESLGDGDSEKEISRFREFIEKMPAAEDTKEKLSKEAARMERMNPQSPDYTVLLNYFEWVTSLPFGVYTKDSVNLAQARRVIDREHYGMQKVKDRILEYLAVFALTGKLQGNIPVSYTHLTLPTK